MNYRHSYHAGCFADVFKHVVLLALVKSLLKKAKPFCYIDTHAGAGRYDLLSTDAQKTGEAKQGILPLLQRSVPMPEIVSDYLQIVRATPDIYPGSPWIVRSLLRDFDHMILSELHPEEVQLLKQNFHADKQVAIHHLDGYQALKAFLPPQPARGLVLIDPPFEKTDEFSTILLGLQTAFTRWPTGIYAVWYPLKNPSAVKTFLTDLRNQGWQKILVTELSIYAPNHSSGLNGSAMVIINAPWQFDTQLHEAVKFLWQILSVHQQGHYVVTELLNRC